MRSTIWFQFHLARNSLWSAGPFFSRNATFIFCNKSK